MVDGVITRPELAKVVIERQGIFSVHREDAALECNCPRNLGPCGGIAVSDIPLVMRTFQLLCMEKGKRFIERQRPRGYEWRGGDLLLHGPWPSKVQNLQSADSPVWATAMNRDYRDDEEHPERILHVVGEAGVSVFMDYILCAEFLFHDVMTDLELPSDVS